MEANNYGSKISYLIKSATWSDTINVLPDKRKDNNQQYVLQPGDLLTSPYAKLHLFMHVTATAVSK